MKYYHCLVRYPDEYEIDTISALNEINLKKYIEITGATLLSDIIETEVILKE